MKRLTAKQRAEITEAFKLSFDTVRETDIQYLLAPNREFETYKSWEAGRPFVLENGDILLPHGTAIVRYRKNIPRGKGKKPSKVLFQIRLEQTQVDGLKALGGNSSAHIRAAIDEYLKKSGGESA